MPETDKTASADLWIDPELTAMGAFFKDRGLVAPDPRTSPMADVRAAQDKIGSFLAKDVAAVATERDVIIAGKGGDIACRLYVPEGSAPPPLLIYFHGGGFAYGSAKGWDGLMRALVHASGVAILNVDYRLAPEHRFPAAVHDATAVFDHARTAGADWTVDPSRLAAGGDSAGANLALVAALNADSQARADLRLLLLFYGVYSDDTSSESWTTRGSGAYGLSLAQMEWVWTNYLVNDSDRKDLRATPLHADLSELPPILQIVGTLDPLIDDANALKARLDEARVANRLTVYRGVNHGFIRYGSHLSKARDAIAEAGAALRKVVVDGSKLES